MFALTVLGKSRTSVCHIMVCTPCVDNIAGPAISFLNILALRYKYCKYGTFVLAALHVMWLDGVNRNVLIFAYEMFIIFNLLQTPAL